MYVVSVLYKAKGQTADWISFALTAKLAGIHSSLWSLLTASSILSRTKTRDTLLLYETTSPRSLTIDFPWGSESLPGTTMVLQWLVNANSWYDQWWASWNLLNEEFSDRPSHPLFSHHPTPIVGIGKRSHTIAFEEGMKQATCGQHCKDTERAPFRNSSCHRDTVCHTALDRRIPDRLVRTRSPGINKG